MLKNNRNTLAIGFITFIVFIECNIVNADEYHYNDMLIGNRATGLAGSYVAISDDPSGLYYNPSGIVYSTSGNVTANMNAYNVSQTKYIGALKNARGESIDWNRSSAALVPNFFGITQPLGPGTVGFSYAITDSILEDQNQTFYDIRQAGTQYTINFNNQDVTNNVGPSYAFSINNKFSIGMTLYAYFRNQKRIFNQIYQLAFDENKQSINDPVFFISNDYRTLNSFGVKPIIGVMYTPAEKISLGLAFSQVYIINNRIDDQQNVAVNICENSEKIQIRCTDTAIPTRFILAKSSSNEKKRFPWQINMGATYFYSNKLILTGNIWVYENMAEKRRGSGNAVHDGIHNTFGPLINVAGGFEYYITGKLAIRMGTYTNLSNTAINPNDVTNEHLDIIGTTLSFTHFTRSSAISVGTAGTYGLGKANVAGSQLQKVEYKGLSIYLSASNSF